MGSVQKPHIVFVPFPAQGHVTPHMQLARVLHARGFHITLVHTELHHRRLARAKGAEAAASATWFDVEVIPDGLSLEAPPTTLEGHHDALERNCLQPFKELLRAMANRTGVPPVSCVVADAPMMFAPLAARDVGVPDVQFFTASACGLMGYMQFEELVNRGLVPLKGTGYKADGSLDAPLDWMPGMKGMRLKDMPTFCHTTDADNALLRIHLHQMRVVAGSKAILINTFHDIEKDVLDALAAFLPPIYTVGPLSTIIASLPASGGDSTDAASLLEVDKECMAWLDGKEARSVVYVSYGSHAAMSADKIKDFASGLARCGSPYLWVLRPDMAAEVEVGKDGIVVPWCAQEAVLAHPAVGLFVTHCGWNSILETVLAGVPVLGWPMISEQTTNCRQLSTAWNIGAELPQEAGGDEIAALVREMLVGKKGMEARERTLEWKRLAEDATIEGGSSCVNLDRLESMERMAHGEDSLREEWSALKEMASTGRRGKAREDVEPSRKGGMQQSTIQLRFKVGSDSVRGDRSPEFQTTTDSSSGLQITQISTYLKGNFTYFPMVSTPCHGSNHTEQGDRNNSRVVFYEFPNRVCFS